MTTRQISDERPILCGIDFSPTSLEAVEIAAAISRKLKTRLVLVHVDEFRGLATVDPGVFDATLSRKQGELDREAARLKGAGTVVEAKLLSGSVFDQIIDTAIDCGARLIVVGAVGHGLARRLLVGSVAERTAEASPVPTLVTRAGGRLTSWLRGEHPLRILVGYDFSGAGDAALLWTAEMRVAGSV